MPIIVSGCIGPRGDGYDPGTIMTRDEATDYHARQAQILADAGAEMLSALTMTNVNEAIGIVRAAQATGLPVAISFTVETDGRLPTGDRLEDAIAAVDEATGMPTPPISASTAPTRPISPPPDLAAAPRSAASRPCAPTPPNAATRNSKR